MGFDYKRYLEGLANQQRNAQAEVGTELLGPHNPEFSPRLVGQLSYQANSPLQQSFDMPLNARGFFAFTTTDTNLLQATGDVTQITYLYDQRSQHFLASQIATAVDTSVTFLVNGKAAGQLYVVATPDPVTTANSLSAYSEGALTVAMALDQPADNSQVAQNTAVFNITLAANATLDLVAAVAGQRIYPLAWNFVMGSAAGAEIQLEDDAGFITAALVTTIAQPGSWDLHGPANLSLGHKMRLHNISGVAAGALAGVVPYSQF